MCTKTRGNLTVGKQYGIFFFVETPTGAGLSIVHQTATKGAGNKGAGTKGVGTKKFSTQEQTQLVVRNLHR